MWETATYKKYEQFIAPYFHFLEYILKDILQLSHEIKKYVSHLPLGIKHLNGRQIIAFRVPTHGI